MLLIIPYSTDAPVYHWPAATVGLIVSNCFIFALQVVFPEFWEDYVLQFGILNPIQWLSAFFMHLDAFHLIGNMIFLWVFGLIVEGKIGWKLFLLVYLAVGTVCSILLQVLMLGASVGGMLGASGAIFGLVAIAMIWAPMNEINFKVFGWVMFYIISTEFEISISTVAFFYIASDFFWAYMGGFQMSTPFIHLTGAIVGAVVGFQMLRRRWVNCEGYDLISMYQGKLGEKPEPTPAEIEEERKKAEERKEQFKSEVQKFNAYVASGHEELAYLKLTHLKRMNPRFKVEINIGWKLTKSLVAKKKLKPAVELVEEMIGYHPDNQVALLINLAMIYVQNLERPRKAIETLNRLQATSLTEKQTKARDKIRRLAFKMINNGHLEVGD